jgi:type IV secretion system protein VirB4
MSKITGNFYSLLPWNYITKFHEGVVVQKDGILQRSFAYRAPDADSLSEMEIDSLSVRVDSFARRLGQGFAFFFEVQRFSSQEYPRARFSSAFDTLAPYLVERERERSFTSVGSHFESCYYITVAWRPPVESLKKLASIFVQGASGTDAGIMRENVEFFVNETNALVGLLSNSMFIRPLDNRETVAYLHSSVSFNRHPVNFPHTQILLDRVLPDSELHTSRTMRLGGHYIPIVGVVDFPEYTFPAIFENLNRARIEYRWVTRYICLSKDEAKKEAAKKEKSHRGSKKSVMQSIAETTAGPGAGSTVVNHGAGIKEADSIDAGVELETDQASLGYYTSCVMVWDRDYKMARNKAEFVMNIVNGAGFTCKEETWNALESFVSMMPGQCYSNYRALPVMSYNLSHCVPLSSVWAGLRVNAHAGQVSGVDLPHVTCSTLEGTPFYFNLNPGGDVWHTAIWGPTGAGKSTLLNLLEAQFYRYPNSQVIVFDKGRSCRQICLASGGLFYEPAAEGGSGISFQPLRDLETDRDLMDAVDFLESLFIVNDVAVTPAIRSAIMENLLLMRGIPMADKTLTTFVHYANSYLDPDTKKPVLREALRDYLYGEGKYGTVFDSAVSMLSLDTRFLAIEMEALMNRGDNCVVPALLYLFNMVEKKFDGRLTLLVLDEAWLFLKNEIFSERIAEWLKVLRKKNVAVVFATQDVADVVKSPLKTTIAQQCLTKVFLADNNAATSTMAPVYRDIGLTETEIQFIHNAQMKQDYFYTSPLGRRMFQLDLGPLTLALLGSPDHKMLDALVAEKGPGRPLCREILERSLVDYLQYMGPDAPDEGHFDVVAEAAVRAASPGFLPPSRVDAAAPAFSSPAPATVAAAVLDAVSSVPDRRRKGDGHWADEIAKKLGVSPSTIYQAKIVIRHGDADLIERVRRGEVGIKKASKSLRRVKAGGAAQ